MADDTERLVVLLEARIRDFEKNMAKASGTADRNYDRMRKGSRSATRQMEADMQRSTSRINRMLASTSTQIGSLGRSFVAGFAGGVFAGGFAGMVRGVRSVVSELSEMGKQIDRVGLSAKVFQELKFGFGEAGVSASEFTTGMEQFTKRIGEASMGTGRLAEILKLNGVALRDQHGRMRSNEALLRDYADLIKNAGSEQEAMTLATEAFGRGGASFVLALRNGADGFDDMAKAAAAAGGTIDEDLIRKAEELDDRWAATWRKFEINAKSAIMSVVTYFDEALSNPTPQLEFDTAEAEYRLGRIQETIVATEKDIERDKKLNLNTSEAEERLENLRQQAAEVTAQLRAMDVAATQLARIGDPDAFKNLPPAKPVRKTVVPTKDDNSGSRGRSRNRAADAALREAEAVRKLIDSLAHELSLIGQSDLEQAKLNARRQAGAAATGDQLAQIDMLVESIHRETEAHERARQAAEARADAFDNVFQMASDGIASIVDGSVRAEDAVKKLAVQLALAAAQAALLGTGPLAGLFGGFGDGASFVATTTAGAFFRNGFSQGVANTGGRRGEPRGIVHGQEAVIPLPSGGRVPVEIRAPQAGTAGSAPIRYAPVYNIDARGAQQGVGDEIAAAITAYDKGRMARLAGDLPELRKRGLA